jgi:hypothetical protein
MILDYRQAVAVSGLPRKLKLQDRAAASLD